jgi:predicted phage tail protein
MQPATRSLERKALILTLVLGCQVMAAMFFTLDVAGDIADAGLGWHLSIELGATLALAAGVVVGPFMSAP